MRAKTIWLFGPSGAGKTTLGNLICEQIANRYGKSAVILDGDEVRKTLTPHLGFSFKDRRTQSQVVAMHAARLNREGSWAVVALITPYKAFRDLAREYLSEVDFIYLDSTRKTRMERDPKGLYALAEAGEIQDLTGYDGVFELPSVGEAHMVSTETGIGITAEAVFAIVEEFVEGGAGI